METEPPEKDFVKPWERLDQLLINGEKLALLQMIRQQECEAGEVYLLMKEEYRISRNIRASWFFGNLNKEIQVKSHEDLINSKEELEVLSIIPKGNIDKSPAIKFKLVPSSHVTFLARRYRLVIVMDLSPSMATVDIQSGRVSLLDLFRCISNCLKGLVMSFTVPGSTLLLSPKIYVTVIAYTPLALLTTQQVLFQGCLLTQDNLPTFLDRLQEELEEFENKVVDNMFMRQHSTNSDLTFDDGQHQSIFDDIIDSSKSAASCPPCQRPESDQEMASPEACFVNMLWCGILALQLLPDNTSAGIICVTDGVTAMPDVASTNHILTQMRNSTVACSFLQVGRGFHPHCCFGYIPHTEIMQFIATATFGAFLSKCPEISSGLTEMNQYHRAFLSWNFQKGLDGIKIDYIKGQQHQVISTEVASPSEGIQLPAPFAVNKQGLCTIPLIRKKHRDYILHTSLANVLSVRLREGYTIKDVALSKNEKQIEVKLALPWKYNGRIEYIASSAWPLNPNRHLTSVDVIMEGSYEFLHDVTCRMKKSPHNAYRTKVVMNFWQTLRSLQETDHLLVHLQSFSSNSIYYTVPEGIKKGLPLLYMPPYSETPVLAQKCDGKDSSLEQFAGFWKRIALMEPKKWQRWLHTHRIALLLVPDMPLPRHLYLPNSNGRYNNIQSRVAQKELNSLLTEFSTFTLLENHSYITLTSTDANGPPSSFYLIRVQSKAPCVVIRLAFLGGTPGHERNKIVSELRQKLQDLTVPMKQSCYIKATSPARHKTSATKVAATAAARSKAFQQEQKLIADKPCVIILARPIDIVLVKYKRMPSDFTDLKTSIQVTTGSVPVYMDNKGPTKDLNRLACYLHHHRWIWDAQSDQSPPISMEAAAHILSILTDLRLQEGFHFSYSNSGIISFVAELKMKNPMKCRNRDRFPGFNQTQSTSGNARQAEVEFQVTDTVADDSDDDDVFPCLVQYIIFPPHTATHCVDRTTGGPTHPDLLPLDEQDTAEADGRLQLVTEVWVEPQSGTAFDVPTERDYFQNCYYDDVPQVIFPLDHEVISTLLTFEHLRVMCHDTAVPGPVTAHPSTDSMGERLKLSESITHLPCSLEVLKLLPKCQQAEILCSTFIEGTSSELSPANGPNDAHPRPYFPRYPKPNNTLYCLLLNALTKMTDHELTLSEEDSLKFVKMVLGRNRDWDNHPAPFNLTDGDFETIMANVRGQILKGEAGRTTSFATELSDSLSSTQPEAWHQAMRDTQNRRESIIPRWICYVKDIIRTPDADKDAKPVPHLVLVFAPASYEDLQKLMNLEKVKDDDGSPECSKVDANIEIKSSDSGKLATQKCQESVRSQKNAWNADSMPEDVAEDLLDGKDETGPRQEADLKQCLTLPIYIYDCSLSSLRHQLLKHEDYNAPSDVFQNLTFASLEAQQQSFTSSRSGNCTPHGSLSRHSSKSHLESGDFPNRSLSSGQPSKILGRFCSQLGDKISKYFVMGIFKSLQRGQYIDAHDVQMALDYICVESLHDIDITHFLHAVCGHVRKYCEKMSLEEQASSLLAKKIQFADQVDVDQDEDDADLEQSLTRSHLKTKSSPRPHKPSLSKPLQLQSVKVPLTALTSSKPCPTGTSDLHRLIQKKFTEVMGYHFEPVPSNPDIWYFQQPEFQDIEIDVLFQEGGDDEKSISISVEPEKLPGSTIPEETNSEQISVTSYTSDNEEIPISENKINSIFDVYQSSLRRGDKNSCRESNDEQQSTSTESLVGSYEEEMCPLFVHLVCSVKLKNNVGNMSRRTLPTCLGHLINCLENPPEEEIDPADLSVTLDLICLTLPPELYESDHEVSMLDHDAAFSERRREISFSECTTPPQSPQPQVEDPFVSSPGKERHLLGLDDVDGHGMDQETLGSLTEQQIKAIQTTEEGIKWLLKDEIAFAKHHIVPVTLETLDMVAQHVKDSHQNKPSCKAAEIPLEFVFGAEESLAKFTEELERSDIHNCELCKVSHYYYLMYDQTHVENTLQKQALQCALENLGEQEPHRLVNDKASSVKSSSFPSTTIICTPPSPCKVSRADESGAVMTSHLIPENNRGPSEIEYEKPGELEGNVSESSDSSIQILSEEHGSDVKRRSHGAEAQIADLLQQHENTRSNSSNQQSSLKDSIELEPQEINVEESNSLRCNSTSFVVLSQVSSSQAESIYDVADMSRSETECLQVEESKDGRSLSSTSSTSTTTLTHKSDSATVCEEDESMSDKERTRSSSEPSRLVGDVPSFGQQDVITALKPLERTSSQSSESDAQLIGRRQAALVSATSSGPPSSQISYTGSLNDNDEEGYEGGSSDQELDDSQELTADQRRHQQLMPDFWLILRIHINQVEVFFHSSYLASSDSRATAEMLMLFVATTRECDESRRSLDEGLYQQVADTIRNACRIVNQRLLLQDLNKTHSCKSILFGESEEDIWQSEDPMHSRISKPSLDEDADDFDHAQKGYRAAVVTFNPGDFACDLMWNTYLHIHARLDTGHRGGSVSPGMQALVSALSTFAVANRRNMFVFREVSGAVFYLRLFETTIVGHSSAASRGGSAIDTGHHYEPSSQPMSRATSVQSLNTLAMGSVFEDDISFQGHLSDSRKVSVVDSGVDTMSMLSRAVGPNRMERAIRLDVHGVDPPGPEIREKLVERLRNKLDEATLDVISLMLDRNPMCKLTPHDVQFIQPLDKLPTETVHFTVPPSAREHLFSLAFYLGQNLRQFLHTPKYSSPKPEDHFLDYRTVTGAERERGLELPDNEVYLYNRPERAGRTGNGIACISMGLVDGCGNPVALLNCPRPSPVAHIELQEGFDFQSLTLTEKHYMSSESPRKPGPTALIQFAIWQRGNVDLPNLTNRLMRAVQHSLCDVVMEYLILTAPMGILSWEELAPYSPCKESERLSQTADILPGRGVWPLFRDIGDDKTKDTEHSPPVTVKRSLSMGEVPMFFASDIKQFMRRMQKPHLKSANIPPIYSSYRNSHEKRSQSMSSSANNDGSSRIRKQQSLEKNEEKSSGSQPSTPVKTKKKDASPKAKDGSHMPGWQAQELERRQGEEIKQRQREAEEGKLGVLHPFFKEGTLTWLDYEHSLDVPTVQKFSEELSSRFSLELVITEFLAKLPTICLDVTTKVYKDDGAEYKLWNAAEAKASKSQEKLSQDHTTPAKATSRKQLPGKYANYILIGRNIHQWRYSLDSPLPEDLVEVPSLVSPSSHKSYQRFKPLDLNAYGSSEKSNERDSNPLAILIGLSQGLHLTPRQRLLLMRINDRKIVLFVYNWSSELTETLKNMFHRLVMWHNSRSHLLDCMVTQKQGLFNHTYFGKNKLKNNPFCKSLEEIESLVKYPVPPLREFTSKLSVNAPKTSRRLHRGLPPFDETLRNAKLRRTLQHSSYGAARDPIIRQGAQMLEICVAAKKENEMLKKLENLYVTWQKRGTQTTQPVSRETLDLLKQSSRLVHYCATPLLFSPTWRQLIMNDTSDNDSQMIHAPSVGGTAAEEAWHIDLRSSFLQQYVQFLQKLGMTPIETKVSSPRQLFKTVRHKENVRSQSPVHHRKSSISSASQYLQVTVAGGIILIELSFQHAYFCVKIFAFESSRVPAGGNINQQLTMLFTDDCDQYKDMIHLHSFAHDFHLRTIQTYFTQPQMGFKARYHVTSFLADFVRYYTPRPKFCRNHIHEERQGFLSHNTPAPLLYQYLMQHPPVNMKKLSMVKPTPDTGGVLSLSMSPGDVSISEMSEEEEYAVVNHQLRTAYFKDNKGNRCHDDMDCSLVICWNKTQYRSQTRPNSPTPTTPDLGNAPSSLRGNATVTDASPNLLNLCFFVIVTSKRELYPIQQSWGRKYSKQSTVAESGIPPSEGTHSYVLLKDEVHRGKERIITTVRQAASNCRRDTLWDQLLQGETVEESGAIGGGKKAKKKDGDDSKEVDHFHVRVKPSGLSDEFFYHLQKPNVLRMTYPEFKVLLDTVHQVHLSQIDERLIPLLSNGITWYEGLLRFLRSKFTIMTRFFCSEDRLVSHLALINPNHSDMMVLLTVDKQANMSELVSLFREEPQTMATASFTNSQQVLATQRHVEIVINAVAYYTWTTMT